ncbi:unnamed protein product [Heterotrigona itama]|uniref:Uracil-DNA glycosylase-like domain-containing protein n=1 Tax=Heterotrigona itama TaxID=395501 RepID=A0A6V7H479_9HYME|nr:unnamed protein product [Heterotrigona itama]
MVIILYIEMSSLSLRKLKKAAVEKVDRQRKRIDRFDGLTEEEVQKYTLPDYLEMNLDVVFVGINPGLMAAHRGRYYAGPARATRSSADLKRTEIKEGSKIVEEKLRLYKPKIAVFNGKCIYEVFASRTGNFNFGLQPEKVGDTAIWVTPSSSARCANFPRMIDKLQFFTSLRKYLQFLKGEIKNVDMKEFSFEGKCKQFIPRTSKMWRRKNISAFLHGGRIANKDTICLDTSDENVAMARSTEFIVRNFESERNDKTDKILGTDESDSSQDFEACISQDTVKTFFESNESPKRLPQSPNDIATDANHTVVGDVKKPKCRTNGKKKKDVKKFSKKPIRREGVEKNINADFINLIKQRLIEKINNFE